MIVRGMEDAVSAWRITAIIMRVFPDVSFHRRRKRPMTEALRLCAVTEGYCEKGMVIYMRKAGLSL